jgi:hypothetical protein
MANLWHWVVTNWGPLGIGAGLGYCLGAVFNAFKWRYSTWTDWKQERQEKANKNLDVRVFQSLSDVELPRSSNGMTSAGKPLTRPSEIAAYLEADRDDVEDSLSRLELRRRVSSDRGWWFPISE